MDHWDELLAVLDDRAIHSNTRQDASRENIFLCISYAQLKRLEYASYLGFSLAGDRYDPDTAAFYRPESRFTGEERLLYALSLLRGHSYQEFYTAGGANGYDQMRPKARYLDYLRKNLALTDSDDLRRQLLKLIELGFLNRDNHQAAVEMLLRARLTEATAFLLDEGNLRWPREPDSGGADFFDAEFQL